MLTQQWSAQQSGGASGWFLDLSRTEQLFGDPAMRVFMKNTSPANPGTSGGSATTQPVTGTF